VIGSGKLHLWTPDDIAKYEEGILMVPRHGWR
jgi:hypothetical protein